MGKNKRRKHLGTPSDGSKEMPQGVRTRRHVKAAGFFLVIAILLGLAVYSNTFRASFQFDDRTRIVSNPLIKSVHNLGRLWDSDPTRALTNFTLAANYALGKLDPTGYHVFNVFIHILNAFVVFLFLRSTLDCGSSPSPTGLKNEIIAGTAALIFLVHPLQTGAVTYVIQRATLLVTLFYLLALVCYLKYRRGGGGKFYILSLLSAAFGALCKPIIITLPLAVALVEFAFLRKKEAPAKRSVGYVAPYLGVVVLLLVLQMIGHTGQFTSETSFGLTGETGAISRPVYLRTQFNVLATYLRLFFFPVNQNADYDYALSRTLFEFPTFLSFWFLTVLLGVALGAFKRYRMVSFSIFWFFITLSSESSIYPIADVIFEHRMYLPMAGLSVIVPSGLFLLLKDSRKVLTTALLIIIVLAAAAFKRNAVWRDPLTFWIDVADKSMVKARPYLNLGKIYLEKGDFKQALQCLDRAVKLDQNKPEAYNNRGYIYNALGQTDRAVEEYSKALQANPKFTETYNNRGYLYLHQGRYDQALADFNRAIELNPENEVVYNNRGNVYLARQQYDLALADYDRAVMMNPDYGKAYHNRGTVYRLKGNYARAVTAYTRAVAIDPDFAVTYYHRSLSLAALGQKDKALADAAKARGLGYPVDEGYLNGLKK